MRKDVIFVDVDTQHDFMDENGALPVPNAESIRGNLKRLTEAAQRSGVPVIATVDTHAPDDPEFEQFGPHCVAGSPGAQKIPETSMARRTRLKLGALPGENVEDLLGAGQVVMEKDTLDALDTPAADKLLNALPDATTVVYGVTTEYCVRRAARKLLDLGRRLVVVQDAVRAISEEEHEKTLDELTSRGARLATTDQVIERLAGGALQELFQAGG